MPAEADVVEGLRKKVMKHIRCGFLAVMVVMAGIGKSSRGHGRWFAVREGGRTVGSGRVATIIE